MRRKIVKTTNKAPKATYPLLLHKLPLFIPNFQPQVLRTLAKGLTQKPSD